MFHRLAIFAAVAALVSVQAAHAADPAVGCESGKLKASGKYASCLLGADAKALLKNTSPDYTKCGEKIDKSWLKAETKGAGQCPNGEGDQSEVQSFLDACSQSASAALEGTTPLPADPITCDSDLTTCSADLATCDGDLLTCDTDLTTCGSDLTTCDGDLTTCDGALTTCEGDLAACEALPVVLKTGQTTCYNAAGAVIACAGTGQDGELQLGAARSFTVNTETITDNVTGLMWEKLTDDGTIHDKDNTYTWVNAFAKVATLNSTSFAGFNDWRVPNRLELDTLVNAAIYNPATYSVFNSGCTPGCTSCSCTASSYYWSSTTYAGYPAGAWGVYFGGGNVDNSGKSNALYARAVRGGS